MVKRILLALTLMATFLPSANAVLKEENLSQTLTILRAELTRVHEEQERNTEQMQSMNERTRQRFWTIWQQSNQNALMLYSQKPDYVFDLTYACHEATNQFREFKTMARPFHEYIEKMNKEVTRYDSLVKNLREMPLMTLSEKARIDHNVCLTYAINIRKSIIDDKTAFDEYIDRYNKMEQHLKRLNDYANLRYNDIQNNIFNNVGESYFSILKSFKRYFTSVAQTVDDKYRPMTKVHSQWDSRVIRFLFIYIILYALVAIALNLLFFRFALPQRFQTTEFKKKRSCTILATTVITFAVILAFIITFTKQNFIIMASELLIEYAWLLGVILLSLLLRIEGDQIKSAFRIYSPLMLVGFIVIAFRIILIPNDLVNLIFPPLLLVCTVWQWSVIRRHNSKIPRSDVFYTYISLIIFVVSTVSSWVGYTLLSVQVLIWWIMQLTCILTITCITRWMKNYSEKHHIYDQDITQTWFFRFVFRVLLPVLGLLSIPLSIYMAARIFNLSDMTWFIFTMPFINISNFRISILSIIEVISLYFLFGYINRVSLDFLRLHFKQKHIENAGSREVMGKNLIQVIVWGAWLLISLAILRVSGTWLGYIAGGLSTGIGFASKDILENIYYGLSLMAGRIKVGDWIQCDGIKGKVSSISYTSTMIETIDGTVMAFTNSQLFTKNYKNLTKNHGHVLAIIPFGVAYGTNTRQMCKMIEEKVMALHHPYLDPAKRVKVVFTEFGSDSINFKLLCWVDAVKETYAVSDVMECIYDSLNAHNIEIPFPQRDIHIKTE